MTTPMLQPALAFNFSVTMWDVQGPNVDSTLGAAASAAAAAGQLIFGTFAEVAGLESDLEIETYQEGGRNDRVHRFLKTAKFPNLVLKRGTTARGDLWDWQAQVMSTSKAAIRKSGLVILFDRNGPGGRLAAAAGLTRIPIAAWLFERGLPEKLQGPALDAKSSTVAIELLEISHERLTRVSVSTLPGLGDIVSKIPTLT